LPRPRRRPRPPLRPRRRATPTGWLRRRGAGEDGRAAWGSSMY
jgi:hypothetical protein